MDHKQIKGDHNNTHKFVMHPLKHIDDILRRAPKSTFSTIYFADEVMEDKGCED